PRFLLVCAVRITGHVDLALLQGALDDVVARHELLRTLVVRDADPPYQEIYPPCQVPLEVKDLPSATGKSRDIVAQELIAEAEAGRISAQEVPTLRALLCRFDDRDSALVLTVHHSVSDGWSLQVILRDLGAFYAARRSGLPAKLSEVRQYREYAEWQKASATSTAEDGAPRYWQDKLRGAREFTIPNDHGHLDSYSSPYSLYNDTIDADVMSAASALATRARSTTFTVLLSAFYVLAHNITGATDLAIRAFTAGRSEEQFQDTMGLFINVLPFRTDLADCTSFRDILIRAKETFVDALAHELPVTVIEQTFPDFVKSRENLRTSQFIISETPTQLGDVVFPIAEGAREVHQYLLEESRHHDIPTGLVWGLTPTPDGGLCSGVLFNPDEFDESTVAGWAAGLRQILTSAVRDPDQDWKTL
ncbi:MAG TPA: condensation domain-containing protein, partial [Streptosporangiaceae bacterium]|nr:condensation domain-containing protein [Streptosporangiaceae bacterium]